MSDRDAVRALVDSCPDRVQVGFGDAKWGPEVNPETGQPEVEEAVALLEFSQRGFGFGEITIVSRGGRTFIDAETMSRAKVLELLAMMVRDAYLDTEDDPERAAAFAEVMRKPPPEGPQGAHEDLVWLRERLLELKYRAREGARGPWVQEHLEQLIRRLA